MWVCRNVIGTTHPFLMVGIPAIYSDELGGWWVYDIAIATYYTQKKQVYYTKIAIPNIIPTLYQTFHGYK